MNPSPVRVVIVDDEPLARRRMDRLVRGAEDFQVVGEAANGIDALRLFGELKPDVMFLDVQMPGVDGLGVASRLPVTDRPLLVFVTAFDQFAASAFDLDAVDFLLKPYDQDRFEATISRIRRRLGRPSAGKPFAIEHLLSIAFGRVRLLPVAAVERIDAAGNYVEVAMADGAAHLVRHTISALAAELPSPPFFQVNRSSIIRVDRVAEVVSKGRGDAEIVLADGTRTTLSRRYRAKLPSLLVRKSRSTPSQSH